MCSKVRAARAKRLFFSIRPIKMSVCDVVVVDANLKLHNDSARVDGIREGVENVLN